MKKSFMFMLALVLGLGVAQARPVSVSQAKYVGQQFVQANFEQTRQGSELALVYTGTATRGEACFYVFNVGNEGFVIISADDVYRPIVGYSYEGPFDVNINPELGFMLDGLIEHRSGNNLGEAAPMVAAEWEMVSRNGRQLSFNGGRAATYLCQTKWNQDYPYNYYCPQATGGPGGRVYAGCVASAMSQVMKYWDYPTKGSGSHTNPNGGSANFGETTYDWANMPNAITQNSPQEQIDAIATLMYHCAVSVNMQWSINGSGAISQDVPGAIRTYFGYTNQATFQNRDSFSYANWAAKLKESFDMGWPIYYSGRNDSNEGHAFVCDGYDDADLYHYNWGWGGSGDGWFDFDGMEFHLSCGAVFNFVPDAIYKATPQAPTNLSIVPAANNALSATVSWVNPRKDLNNQNLSNIDQIVVERNGQIVYTEENVTPGATMTITDNTVPRFDAFVYKVYAISSGNHGRLIISDPISFGPTCGWTVTISQASFTGFRGGAIHLYNASGTEFAQVTTTTSSVQNVDVDMPVGHISMGWSAPTQGTAFNMSFSVKDSQNNVVYTFTGSSADMPEGIFYQGNNGCGNQPGTAAPSNLIAVVDDENPYNINVSWDGINESGYGYTVYRDGLLYRLIPEGTSFVDENAPIGGHCYQVGYLGYGGENTSYSNESCATSGECFAPRNLDFEYTGNNHKIKLTWERPEPSEGLSGYYLFRKFGEDGTYERIKLLGANATNHTDNSANQQGDYYYKLYAVYQDLGDCVSAPANRKYEDNVFYLHAPYYTDGIGEMDANEVAVYPNPTNDCFTVEGQGLSHVSVFNAIGQMVYDANCSGNSAVVRMNQAETGVYMVRIATENGIATKRVTIIK